jgi:hypothetical protein
MWVSRFQRPANGRGAQCADVVLVRVVASVWIAAGLVGWCQAPRAQQLLDRVVARVNGLAITLSDVRAATGVGVIESTQADVPGTLEIEQAIDRQLLLAEVARFGPPEPRAAAIDMRVAALKANAGSRLSALMQSTGLDENRLRDMARDELRIEAYLDQRFGTTVQVSDEEAARYYAAHPEEFTRDGTLIPLGAAAEAARRAASEERRRTTVTRWISDLRARAEVVINVTPPAPPRAESPAR